MFYTESLLSFYSVVIYIKMPCQDIHEAKNPVAMSWGWCNRSACSFIFRAGATLPLSYPHLTTVWGGTAGNWIALNGNCSCPKLYQKRKRKKKQKGGTNRFLQHIIKCKGNWTEDSALWNTVEETCISGLDTSVPCTVWLISFCPHLHCRKTLDQSMSSCFASRLFM